MASSDEDLQVGHVRGSKAPVYQSRSNGGLYWLDTQPKRYIMYRNVEFLGVPKEPSPKPRERN